MDEGFYSTAQTTFISVKSVEQQLYIIKSSAWIETLKGYSTPKFKCCH